MFILFKVLCAWKRWELRIKPDFIRQAWAFQTCFLLPTSIAMSLLSASAPWPASGKVGPQGNPARLGEGDFGLAAEKWRDLKFISFWGPHTWLSTARRHLPPLGICCPGLSSKGNTYPVSYKMGTECHSSFKMQLEEERPLCPPCCVLLEPMPNAQKTTVQLQLLPEQWWLPPPKGKDVLPASITRACPPLLCWQWHVPGRVCACRSPRQSSRREEANQRAGDVLLIRAATSKLFSILMNISLAINT